MTLARNVLGGAAVFGAAVWGGFSWAKSGQQREAVVAAAGAQRSGAAAHGGRSGDGTSDDGCCAFDRLADAYDGIVGAEERGMFMGLLRWWLLRDAEGDVLEISAGTGRNLPHYPFSSMRSLTLTDVSAAMLEKARQKFFDELQLQYKQPGLSCSFMLADAQHMLASGGQPPHSVLLPAGQRHWQQQQQQSSTAAERTQPQQQQSEAAEAQSVWRFKKQRLGSANTTAQSSSAASGSSGPAAAATEAVAAGSSSPASSSPSTSKGGWRWTAPALTGPCSCREHATDAAANSASSSSSSSSSSKDMSTYAPQSFDVVVDTFGLCSCSDPVQVLQQAAQLVKPGGKLLLLEHGRSSWEWLNAHMDERAAHHHATYGCWYNRDILGVVEQAGLRVHSCSRWHLGTSYLIVASPPAAGAGDAAGGGSGAGREQAARAA